MAALLLMALPECIYAAPQKEIANENDLIEYLRGKKEKDRVTVEFACPPKLYSELSGFPATNVITIRAKQLYPGIAIILAEKSGDLSKLTEKEKKTREAALKVAKVAENKSPIQTAKYIHG